MERESTASKNANLNIDPGVNSHSIRMQKRKTKEYERNEKNKTNI